MSDTTTYARIISRIERLVDELNHELARTGDPEISFGYIGNLERWGDDRAWFVFLGHPGRPGTDDDGIGGFATGDVDGAKNTLVALHGFRMGLNYRRRGVQFGSGNVQINHFS